MKNSKNENQIRFDAILTGLRTAKQREKFLKRWNRALCQQSFMQGFVLSQFERELTTKEVES